MFACRRVVSSLPDTPRFLEDARLPAVSGLASRVASLAWVGRKAPAVRAELLRDASRPLARVTGMYRRGKAWAEATCSARLARWTAGEKR